MTLGNVLYLLMSIGMFIALAVVLAYQSWHQSRLGPDMIADAVPQPETEPERAIAA